MPTARAAAVSDALFATAVAAGAFLLLAVVVHELLHVLANLVFAGAVANCGPLGPVTLVNGRPTACITHGGRPVLNALLAPLLTAAVGVVLMEVSGRVRRRGLAWGLLVAGIATWLTQTLYALAYYQPPTITAAGVHYWGDGVVALEAWGWPAQIPGACLLAVGLVVLSRRVQFQR